MKLKVCVLFVVIDLDSLKDIAMRWKKTFEIEKDDEFSYGVIKFLKVELDIIPNF
jgi:hypothetical protein